MFSRSHIRPGLWYTCIKGVERRYPLPRPAAYLRLDLHAEVGKHPFFAKATRSIDARDDDAVCSFGSGLPAEGNGVDGVD